MIAKSCHECERETFDDPAEVDVCIECAEPRVLCDFCDDLAIISEPDAMCPTHRAQYLADRADCTAVCDHWADTMQEWREVVA